MKNFDPFRKQKRYAFESSIDAMNMVTNSLELENLLHEELEKHFIYLVKVIQLIHILIVLTID